MLVEPVAQPHCLYLLCTEAIKYVYTILYTEIPSKFRGLYQQPVS